MNRILKRPMFRIGGSTGTGITSGLDQSKGQMTSADMNMKIKKLTEAFIEYKQRGGTLSFEQFSTIYAEENFNSGGRVGLQVGGRLGPGTLPGFLTGLGINLASITPRGNIFATAAEAAKDPFERFQTAQLRTGELEGERAFQRELSEEERDFQRELQREKLDVQKEIAGMDKTDTIKRVQTIADTKYDGDIIKAQREVDFGSKTYPGLVEEYGQESVATSVIDSSGLQKQKDIDRFVKQNPTLTRQVVYDVRTGKAVRFGLVNGKYTIQPADSNDVDDMNFAMPEPEKTTPGLFGQKTKPGRPLKEILPDFTDPGFDEEFYQ
tara:strand:+ start:80 stop:1048 length:969 start_codon:yes stop_codon:yes gene_type:complete